jgi:hypothetical protein
MDLRTAMLKAYEKKFREQSEEVNSKLARFERVQAKILPTERVKTSRQEIEEFQELKRPAKAQLEAEVDADVSKVKSSMEHFVAKLKTRLDAK